MQTSSCSTSQYLRWMFASKQLCLCSIYALDCTKAPAAFVQGTHPSPAAVGCANVFSDRLDFHGLGLESLSWWHAGSDSAPCIDALCIVVFPTSTCCPDGYLCMGSSDGTGSHACQPSIFPVVPPNLMRPRLVSNASLINDALLNAVLPPLPSSAIPGAVLLPSRLQQKCEAG